MRGQRVMRKGGRNVEGSHETCRRQPWQEQQKEWRGVNQEKQEEARERGCSSNWQPGGKPKAAEARLTGKSMERARLCKELVRREMIESRSQSTGRPEIVLTVTSAHKAKERAMGEAEVSMHGVQHRITAVRLPWVEESKSAGLQMAPPNLTGSKGLASSKEMNSANESGRSDINQRWKRRWPALRAPQVSTSPQRAGFTEASEPKSKAMCGRPLSTAMGMGGRMGGRSAIEAENDFAIMMRNRARLSTGLRADRRGTPEGGGGREETDEFGDGLGGGR
jgi:hypothetical protein